MVVKNFEDLNVWQQARQLTQEVFRLTKTEDFLKDFGLRDQIRRAAVSVMSNIAEGFERGGNQEFSSFSTLPKGRVERLDHPEEDLAETTRSVEHCRELFAVVFTGIKLQARIEAAEVLVPSDMVPVRVGH